MISSTTVSGRSDVEDLQTETGRQEPPVIRQPAGLTVALLRSHRFTDVTGDTDFSTGKPIAALRKLVGRYYIHDGEVAVVAEEGRVCMKNGHELPSEIAQSLTWEKFHIPARFPLEKKRRPEGKSRRMRVLA